MKINIKNFIKEENKEYHRFNSWQHCFDFFQKEYFKNNASDDLAALNLGFYLASWGMYRGSTYLLQNDYKIHTDVAIYLKKNFKEKYEYSFDEIKIIKKDIIDLYGKAHKNSADSNRASDVLITKILLGTYACVPAYDRFFLKGLYEIKNKSFRLSQNSFNEINEFYELNRKIFKEFENKYPKMKLLDMYFWRVGYEKSKKEIAERKAQKEISLK